MKWGRWRIHQYFTKRIKKKQCIFNFLTNFSAFISHIIYKWKNQVERKDKPSWIIKERQPCSLAPQQSRFSRSRYIYFYLSVADWNVFLEAAWRNRRRECEEKRGQHGENRGKGLDAATKSWIIPLTLKQNLRQDGFRNSKMQMSCKRSVVLRKP